MESQRITNPDDPLFQTAWELYQRAFPENERRSKSQQIELLQRQDYYAMISLLYGEFAGLLFWWDLGKLRYLEHMAVHEDQRGKGYGGQMLKCFRCAEGKRPIILGVETPVSEEGKRRVHFYQEAEFHFLDQPFHQPPLQKEGSNRELRLMSWPEPISKEETNGFRKLYLRQVPHF